MKSIEFLVESGVDVNTSLELFGDIDTYNETIGEFLVGVRDKIALLNNYKDNKDMPNYAIYVHSLKSDAKTFGFTKLSEIALEQEMHSKAGDIFYIQEHFNELVEEVNNSIKIVKAYMTEAPTLPKEEVEDAPSTSETYQDKTILVVDDSNIIRNFVKRIFSDRYTVGTAKDGQEAIEIIKANMSNENIVAILLDLNMPRKDGFAVLDFMSENDLFTKMPVSIISGDSTKETIDRAFTYSIVDMLGKPFNDKDVKNVIEKTMYYKELN